MAQHALRNAKPANSATLMITGIVSSIVVLATYKFIFRPQMLRNRHLEAEKYAEFLTSNTPNPKASEFANDWRFILAYTININ